MIQPTLLARPSAPVLAPPSLAGGDAAFGVSLAALLDVAPPVQPVAAPGKPLPPVLPAAILPTTSPDPIAKAVAPVPEAMQTAQNHAIEPPPAPTTALSIKPAYAPPVLATQSPPVLPAAILPTTSPDPIAKAVAPVPEAMRTAQNHAIEPPPAPTTALSIKPAYAPPVLATQSPPVATLPLTADAPIAAPARENAADPGAPAATVTRALRTLRAIHASASPDTIAAVLAEASAPVDAAPVQLPATKVERHAMQSRLKAAQTPVPSRRVPDPIAGPEPRTDGESREPETSVATATAVFADALSPVPVDPRQVVLTDAVAAEPQPAQRDVVAAFPTPVPLTAQPPASPIEPTARAASLSQATPPSLRPAAIEHGAASAELPSQPKRRASDAPVLAAPVMRDGTPSSDTTPDEPDGERAKPLASQPIRIPLSAIPPNERPIADPVLPPIPAATVVRAGQPATVLHPASPAVLAPRVAATRRVDDAQPTASPLAGLAPETPVPDAMPPSIDGTPTAALQPHSPTVQPATAVTPDLTQRVTFDRPPPVDPAPLDALPSALPIAAPATPSGTATPSPGAAPARLTDAPIDQPDAAIPEPQTPVDHSTSMRPTPAPMPVPSAPPPAITPGATAPAFRLFAQALHAARRDEEVPIAAPAASLDQPRATLGVHAPDGAPLDMGDRRWPQAMVDRIEGLRDAVRAAADFASTSIRLTPAALGTIDVSVRTEGDTVHVHFAAEQAATRTLLNDAQPRLAELAEARGVKLGQASVGAGADGQGRHQPAPQPTPLPVAPHGARRDDEPDTTTRIA